MLSISFGTLKIFRLVLNRSSLLLMLTRLNCSGFATAISCSVVPALASSHLTAIVTFWVCSGNTTENNSSASQTSTRCALLEHQTSAPGSETGTPHELTGCFSKFDIPTPLAGVQFPSSFDSSHLFCLSWENHSTLFSSPSSSSGTH